MIATTALLAAGTLTDHVFAAEKKPAPKTAKPAAAKKADAKKSKPTAADLKLQKMQKEVGNWDDDQDATETKGQNTGDEPAEGAAAEKNAETSEGSGGGEAGDTGAEGEIPATQLNNTAPKPKLDPDKELVTETDEDRVSFWGTLIKAVIVWAFYRSCFYGLRFVAKRQGIERTGEHLVETLAQVPIQPNKQIRLVEVGGRVLVLGNTESQISLLQTIEDQSIIDEMKLSNSERAE